LNVCWRSVTGRLRSIQCRENVETAKTRSGGAGDDETSRLLRPVLGVFAANSSSLPDALAQVLLDLTLLYPHLLHAVPVANGDGAGLQRFAVHGDAEWRARLVLATVT